VLNNKLAWLILISQIKSAILNVWEYVFKKLPFENIEKSAFEIAIPNAPLETLVVAPNSDQILDH